MEVDLPAPPVRDVRVALGRREVGVSEHLLHAAEIGTALEQMRGEGVAEEMRMHPLRFEAGLLREPAENEERTRASERSAARIQE
jgi:hypothetical protein